MVVLINAGDCSEEVDVNLHAVIGGFIYTWVKDVDDDDEEVGESEEGCDCRRKKIKVYN